MTDTHSWRWVLVFCGAIASALTAGIFLAFSTFVMQALAQQPAASGIAAMQAINITVINPWFMIVFFGPAVAGVVLTIVATPQWSQPEAIYWLAGSWVYLIGTIGVTIAGNIPLNEALARVNPHSAEAVSLWVTYLTDWTFWNHVRTVAALVSASLLILSLGHRSELAP